MFELLWQATQGRANRLGKDRDVRLCQVKFRTACREHVREFGCLENAIEFYNSLDPIFKERGAGIYDAKTAEVIKVGEPTCGRT